MNRGRVYYHLSDKEGLKVLYPKWTDPDNSSPVEARASRVCVSSSILGCLRSLQPPSGSYLYVYAVVVDEDTPFIPAKYVQHLVPDAYKTRESWVMCDIRCICDGKIKVTDFVSGNDIDYKWKWIKRSR